MKHVKVSRHDLTTVELEQDDATLTVRYANPPQHFVTAAFVRDLDVLTRAIDADNSVRSVVLTGAEPGAFLTHADPAELGGAMTAPLPPGPGRLVAPRMAYNAHIDASARSTPTD